MVGLKQKIRKKKINNGAKQKNLLIDKDKDIYKDMDR